ncbi:MAG: LTA synthase family protein [Lachnospiraceae bacterium]|jgi:lipoteichoic acid synthase|nr:LTA synthase family protein [Lachnospiraceae bacterium]
MSDARLGRRRPGTGGYREREEAPRRGSEYENLTRFSRQEDYYEEPEEDIIPWSEFDEERPRRTKRRQQNGILKLFSALGPILYFPTMLFYLELAFHIYMGEGIRYFPVWLFFSVSMGFFFSLFAINFSRGANRIITYVLTCLISLIYMVEMMTKKILATYYQLFSIAKTAAGNKLTDYMDAIIDGILHNLFGLFLMLVPVIFIFTIGRKFYNFKRKWIGLSGVVAGAVVVAHLLGLLVIHLPWRGDYTPGMLYQTDTNADDQVQQLGVNTMLRLDLKHSLFGVKVKRDDDFASPDPVYTAESVPGTGESGESDANVNAELPETSAGLFTNTDTSPNVMNVDLETLAANAPNDDLAWLCKYFNSQTPTNKNKYTGAFKGYNVIFVTAEGLTGYGISEELTPTLWKLSHEGFVFNNFYTALHYTSTAGGECQNMLGLYPKNGNPIITQDSGAAGTNWYFNLAQQLNRAGYVSAGYHANGDMYKRQACHTNMGYKWCQEESGFPLEMDAAGAKSLWPQSDLYTVEQTIDQYINSEKPFNVYYLTISGHMQYGFEGNAMARKNQAAVSGTGYTELTQGYLATCIELDKSMEYLLQRLEQAGIADKTLVVLAPDHIPYFNVANIEELAGKSFVSGDSENLAKNLNESMITDYNLYKNTLIMWSGSMKEPVQVDKVCCQVDILPTVSNLLGLEYDSRMLSGTDILSDSAGVVAFNSGCWLSDAGYYNRYDETFTPAAGTSMTPEQQEEYVAAMRKVVANRRAISEICLNDNAYEYIFPGTKNSSSFSP